MHCSDQYSPDGSFSKENHRVPPAHLSGANAYVNVLDATHQPIKINDHYSEPQDSQRKQTINIQQFTASDLEIFADCLEIIARLKKTRYERQQAPKIKRLQKSFVKSKRNVNCRHPTMSFITYDEDAIVDSASLNDCNKLWPGQSYCHKSIKLKPTKENMDGQDSYSDINAECFRLPSAQAAPAYGVYHAESPESPEYHVYEEIHPKVPPANASSLFKSKSLKTPFNSLIKKKQIVQPPVTPAAPNILSSNPYEEDVEYSEIDEHKLDNLATDQKFLDKIMSFLTL